MELPALFNADYSNVKLFVMYVRYWHNLCSVSYILSIYHNVFLNVLMNFYNSFPTFWKSSLLFSICSVLPTTHMLSSLMKASM